MYDELVKRLRELQTITEHCDEQSCDECENRELCDKHDNKTLSGTYKEAADAVEELQKLTDAQLDIIKQYQVYLNKTRWIPVTERLPEAGERVLCYCRANIYEVMKMRTDGDWVHNDQVYDSAYMSGFVTHWMPLPTPPKEE